MMVRMTIIMMMMMTTATTRMMMMMMVMVMMMMVVVVMMMTVRMMMRVRMIGPEPRTTLCASLRSRNACQDCARATSHGNLQKKCRSPE